MTPPNGQGDSPRPPTLPSPFRRFPVLTSASEIGNCSEVLVQQNTSDYFSNISIPAKTTKLYLPRAMFLKLFNPGCISKEIYPYGSHSFTLNSSRWRFVNASWQPRSCMHVFLTWTRKSGFSRAKQNVKIFTCCNFLTLLIIKLELTFLKGKVLQ